MSGRRNTTLIALAVAALSLSIVISGCAGNPSPSGGTASPGPDEITPTPDHSGTQASPTAVPTQPVVSYPPAPPKNTFINTSPPANPVKLIFIHHSSGENWLADGNGGLGIALRENNYFVSDTNYDWGPVDTRLEGPIGSFTDTGHWWNWFLGPDRDAYMSALFHEYGQHSDYSRPGSDPGGENQIVMFKSCFPNSALGGMPGDPPAVGDNPLDGQGSGSMKVSLKLPMFGMNMEEATIVKWLKQPGEAFRKGEPLYEIETEKVISEVAAPCDGTLLEIVEGADTTVAVGDIVCHVEA